MDIVQNSRLEIKENKLSYDKSFIQLSNISHAFVEKESKISYPPLAILGIIVGLVFSMDVDFPWIGLIILAISILILLPTFIKNRNKKYILVLITNSSSKVGFRCKNEDFLVEILELIKNKISDSSNYIINLEECTITNSQIGEKNVMHSN